MKLKKGWDSISVAILSSSVSRKRETITFSMSTKFFWMAKNGNFWPSSWFKKTLNRTQALGKLSRVDKIVFFPWVYSSAGPRCRTSWASWRLELKDSISVAILSSSVSRKRETITFSMSTKFLNGQKWQFWPSSWFKKTLNRTQALGKLSRVDKIVFFPWVYSSAGPRCRTSLDSRKAETRYL